MVLIREIGKQFISTGRSSHKFGLFICPFCQSAVERLLSSGKRQKSCGCAWKELLSISHVKHGASHTRIHSVWTNMKARCGCKSSTSYPHYGRRGIRVCEVWANSFEAFMQWSLENGYDDDLHIDRIDNDGDYSPANCRFVTQKENNRKMRHIKMTPESVAHIRGLHPQERIGNVEALAIAKQYNCAMQTVRAVIHKGNWKDV
jgi:hypothetical protein